MATFQLRDEETEIIDLTFSKGISATNVSTQNARFYIDYEVRKDHWAPVTGEKHLKPGETFDILKVDIGHDKVRVGARGVNDGTIIIKGRY